MLVKRSAAVVIVGWSVVLTPMRASATSPVFYTSEAAFDAVAGMLTTFGFTGAAGSHSTAAGFTRDGVTFVGTNGSGGYYLGAEDSTFLSPSPDYSHGLNLPSLQGPAKTSGFYGISNGVTTITLPAGTTAFGLDLFDVLAGDYTAAGTDTVTLNVAGALGATVTPAYSGAAFIGFTSSVPVSSVTLYGLAAEEFPTITSVSLSGASGPTINTTGGDLSPNVFSLGSAAAQAGTIVFSGGVLRLTGGAFAGNIVTAPVTIGSGNGTVDTSTGNGGFSGVVSGPGALTITGGGTFVLSGANSYAGGTMLVGSTVALGSSSALGTGPLSVAGGTLKAGAASLSLANAAVLASATTIDTQGFDFTYAGAISGGGLLTKIGSGTLTLSGLNSTTGGTAVLAGTLALGNGGAAGTGLIDLADGTTLAFLADATLANSLQLSGTGDPTIDTGASSVVVSGPIAGGGALTKLGSGTLTLTGANSYTGGTVVAAGTLVGSALSFGTGGIADNAALVFDQPSDAAFANPIAGAGTLTKQGVGTLDLTGTNTLTGPTTVAAGALLVDGSLAGSAVTVGSGAALGGTGTVGSLDLLSGATLAPGLATPFSTLKVAGGATFQPGSTLAVTIAPDGRSDAVAIGGAAQINGGTVAVSLPSGSYNAGLQYTILTAAGGRTGTFSALTTSTMPAFLTPVLAYGATTVALGFTGNGVSFPAIAATPNQYAVATALQGLGSGPLTLALQSLTAAEARQALDALSGASHAAVATAATRDAARVGSLLFDRLWTIGSGGVDARTLLQQFALPGERASLPLNCYAPLPATAAPAPSYTAWGEGFGDFGHDGGGPNSEALHRSTGGFVLGIDTPIHGFTAPYRIGLAGGYSNDQFSASGNPGAGSFESVFGSLYGGARYGAVDVRAGGSVADTSTELNRTVAFPGFNEAERAVYGGNTEQLFGEVGYRFSGTRWVAEPLAGFGYVHVHQDGYRERGGVAALVGAASDTDTEATTLGARGEYAPVAGIPLVGRLSLGWRHAFGDVNPTTRLAFAAGSSSFTEQGAPIDRNVLASEAGVDWRPSDTLTLGLSYVGQIGPNDRSNGVKGRLEAKF